MPLFDNDKLRVLYIEPNKLPEVRIINNDLETLQHTVAYGEDALIEMALLEYDEGNFKEVDNYCNKALKIDINERTYINEPFTFNETVYDSLSISNFKLGNYKKALEYVNEAIKINNKNERINNNKILIENIVKEIDS